MPLSGGNATITSAWTNLTTLNGWSNFGNGYASLGFRREDNRIYFRGGIKNTGSVALIATLPVGSRPSFRQLFPVITLDATFNYVLGSFVIDTDGSVTWISGGGTFFSFDGVSFPL